uniref:Uncharacterized protein n=1 Tax=Sphaerodactylus townsendi TaxID=933632 RepID=A0ACB8EQU5_9SAUR
MLTSRSKRAAASGWEPQPVSLSPPRLSVPAARPPRVASKDLQRGRLWYSYEFQTRKDSTRQDYSHHSRRDEL